MQFTLTQKKRAQLEKLFKDYPIISAYLFGSAASGQMTPSSDIDIGLYFEKNTTKEQRAEIRLRLILETGKILKTSNVDLIIMNSSPVFLQFEIIRENNYLYIKDEFKRTVYEAKLTSQYLDQKYYQDRYTNTILQQIAKDGLK